MELHRASLTVLLKEAESRCKTFMCLYETIENVDKSNRLNKAQWIKMKNKMDKIFKAENKGGS